MKFIDEIRRDNLKALAAELGGVAALARTLGRSEAQVSQWTTGAPLPSGKPRGMKSTTARWIEATSGKPAGWLDQSHETPALRAEQPVAAYQAKRHHARPLVQQVCDLAEQINDDGLNQLIGAAGLLRCSHPLVKAKVA